MQSAATAKLVLHCMSMYPSLVLRTPMPAGASMDMGSPSSYHDGCKKKYNWLLCLMHDTLTCSHILSCDFTAQLCQRMLVFGTNHEVTDPRFSDKNSQVYHLRGVCCFNSRRRLPVSLQDSDTPAALYLLDRRSARTRWCGH